MGEEICNWRFFFHDHEQIYESSTSDGLGGRREIYDLAVGADTVNIYFGGIESFLARIRRRGIQGLLISISSSFMITR